MKRFKLFFVILPLCFLPVAALHAQDLPLRVDAAGFPFARNSALGGAHTGLDGDFSSIFTNPAALAGAKPQKNYVELAFDVIDVDLIYRLMTTDNPLPEFSALLVDRFEASLDVGGPFALGEVKNGLGFGVFNVSKLKVVWDRDQIYMVSPTLTEEFTLAGAYGLRLYEGEDFNFDAGITAKVFLRAGYRSPPIYLQQVKYILQDLMDMPFETQLGAGVDIGFRWTLYESVSFAAVVYDPFSPVWVIQYSTMEKIAEQEMIVNGTIPVSTRASAGVSWKMKSPFWHRYFSDITLSFDYLGLLENMSENPRDPLLNISAGCEIRILEALSLRAGFKDMLPSGGIGLNFTFMNIDLSFYGTELGVHPNQYVTWAAAANISFRN
ncbi:MAG: hypothetical protein LBJ35_05055 [Spirochaetaceae bacterium]|nr:hypothetical protein [Spirochaetaceae bacterium]